MKIEHGMQNVREPSKELVKKEMEELAGNVYNSQLCPPMDPVVPTSRWNHCWVSHEVKTYKNVLGISVLLWFHLSAAFAVVSLQSSLNVDEGFGLATLFSSMLFKTIITIASPFSLAY